MSTPAASSTPSPPAGAPSSGELDLHGEVCPYTFVRARLALEALPIGARLTVAIDHAPAAINLPRSLAEWGQEVAEVTALGDGRWTIAVVKRVD